VNALTATHAEAHQLEDGFVERSVAVVVRPDGATVRYSVGANETTRQQLARFWSGQKSADDQSTLDAQSLTFLQTVGDAMVNGMQVHADGNPIDLQLVEVIATPRHHVEATVVMRLDLPKPKLGASSIFLTIKDRSFRNARLASTKVEDQRQVIETPDVTAISITMNGAFRYAFKGAKGAMLNRSTVAPILVRAQRKLLAEIPATQLDAEQQFSAEVILP
jgi:ABC-type dipeptide/oligopeptide/nickel transport system ATPase component